MAFDPDTDDTDVEGQAQQQDLQDRYETAQATPVSAPSMPLRSAAPGVLSPTPAPSSPPQTGLTPPPAYKPPPKFDPSTAKSTGDTFAFPPAAAPKEDKSSWADFGNEVWRSTMNMGSAVASGAKFIAEQANADPEIRGVIQTGKDWFVDQAAKSLDALSPKAQEAAQASVLGYLPGRFGRDAQGNQIPTPGDVGFSRYLASTTAEFLPQALFILVPGGLIAKAVVGATQFGLQGMGDLYDRIHKEIGDAKDSDLMAQQPFYADMRNNQGMSEGQAKAQLSQKAAPLIWGMGAISATVGAGVGSMAAKGILGTAERGALTRMGVGATESGTMMAGQGGYNTWAAGQAQGKPADLPSILADAAAQGLPGAAFGAAAGIRGHAAPPAEDKPPPPPPPKPGVGADEGVALQGELDLSQAPPGPVAGGAQGELFRTTQEAQQPPGAPGPPAPPPLPPPAPVQPSLDLTGAPPGAVPGTPQGELFRTADQAQPASPAPAPAPAPAPTPPPAAQAAIDTSRGTTTAAPAAAHPLDGMKTREMAEAVATLPGQKFTLKTLQGMSQDRLKSLYDKLSPASTEQPQSTTVVTDPAARPEPVAEPTAPGGQPGEAPPSSDAAVGVGSLPAAATEAAAETQAPAPVATPEPEPVTPEPKASDTPVLTGRQATVEPDTLQLPKPTADAVAVSKGRKPGKQTVVVPKSEVKAYAEPVETEPSVDTQAIEQARGDRVQDLAAAVNAIPAPRGSALEGVLRKAQRYMAEAIGRTDGSNDAVAELIHNWVEKEPTKPYPGTTVTARALGEHLMERVTGQKLASPEGARADLVGAQREDIARRPAQGKTITGEHIETATGGSAEEGTEGTAGITPVVTGTKVPETTDYKRIADALMERVRNNEMTPQEASLAYGKQQAGGGGRSRRWKTLADYVRDQIKYAEDPANERAILEKMAMTQNDKTLRPQQKSALTNKMSEELARTGPEAAAELREHLQGMEDPVGQAADTEDQRKPLFQRLTQRIVPRPGGINPRSSRYVQLSRDPRFNADMDHYITNSEAHDVPVTLKDALQRTVNNPLVNSEMPPFRMLASRLLKLSDNVPVYSADRAHEMGLIDDGALGEYQRGERAGEYNEAKGHIVIGTGLAHDFTTRVETLLHEALHSITSKYIRRLQAVDPKHPDLQALRAIARELRSLDTGGALNSFERGALYNATGGGEAEYEPHELLSWAMSNPTVHSVLASHVASPRLRAELNALGFPQRKFGATIWRYFGDWVRRALGMGPASSASEHTLLDHVLRPLEDITSRAAKYNESLLPQDPTLRAQAAPLYQASSNAFVDRARNVLDHMDTRGWGAKANQVMRQFMTSDGIVDRYGKLLPNLENWRAAYEGIARSGKIFADQWNDKAKDLTSRYNKLSNPNELGQLMTDATLAKAHLGENLDAKANDHLKTPDEQAALGALQGRYDALPPNAKALYGEFRDTYAAWYKQKRAAQLGALVRGFMPDATDAEHEAFTRAAASKGALEKFLSDPDNSPLAKAFGDDWSANRAIARGIAQVHNQGWVEGDYFPLRRFGDYVVRYGDQQTPGDYGVEMYESRKQAEARRAELKAAGMEPYQVSSKRDSDMRDIVPNHPAVDELTASLAKRGYPEEAAKEIRDQLNSILLQHATHSAASRAAQSMRRRGVKGASIDHSRILPAEFVSNQAGIGHLEYGLARAKALSDMRIQDVGRLESPTYQGSGSDAVTGASVLREVEKRSTAIDPDSIIAQLGAKANTFSFAQSLMSPSHMLTSSMEAHTQSMALLGARHGVLRASAALTRALIQASPMLKEGALRTIRAVGGELKSADWNMPELLMNRMIAKGSSKAGMTQLFKALTDAGLIDHTMLKDIQQQANPGSRAGGVAYDMWSRFRDFSAASAHAVDVMNKVAISKAAFDLEYRKTGDVNASVAYAVKTARTAMPNYNIGNKARIGTSHGTLGAIGSPLFQFKNYGLHMYTTLANLAAESMHGDNKWEARKALALTMATHAAMAGVLGLPIADALRYIGGAYDLITGQPKPHSYENDLRRALGDAFGPVWGDIISGGLPHALGFDVQHRTGLANMLEMPDMKSFDADGAKDLLFGLATGATGENLENVITGFEKILQGDPLGGIQAAIPRPFRDLMKASNLASRGVVTQRGRTILPADKITTGDVAYQALGFQPSRVTEAREGSYAVQEARDEAQAAQKKLSSAWVSAAPQDRPAIMSQIREFNADPKHQGFAIRQDQLLKDLNQRRKEAAQQGGFGLHLPRKAASQLEQAGSFANYQ